MNETNKTEELLAAKMAKIPPSSHWHKIAVSHERERYVLDPSSYDLPYYEVEWIDLCHDDHSVYFVIPGNNFQHSRDIKEVIDSCNKYAAGPYYDAAKAIREDAKRRGLPAFNLPVI